MWHTVRKNWQKPVVKSTTEHEGEQYVFIIEQGFQGSGHSKIDTIRSHKFRAFKCRQRRTRTIKIDPAELFRVFPKTTPNEQTEPQPNIEPNAENRLIIERLQAEPEAEKRITANMEETVADLRERLDKEGADRRALTAMLTDQTQTTGHGANVGWFDKLLGRQKA